MPSKKGIQTNNKEEINDFTKEKKKLHCSEQMSNQKHFINRNKNIGVKVYVHSGVKWTIILFKFLLPRSSYFALQISNVITKRGKNKLRNVNKADRMTWN